MRTVTLFRRFCVLLFLVFGVLFLFYLLINILPRNSLPFLAFHPRTYKAHTEVPIKPLGPTVKHGKSHDLPVGKRRLKTFRHHRLLQPKKAAHENKVAGPPSSSLQKDSRKDNTNSKTSHQISPYSQGYFANMTIVAEAPFKFKSVEDIERAFIRSANVEELLWSKYGVVAVQNMRTNEPRTIFVDSIVRHVALFYGDYVRIGGKEPRHLGIPECSWIGLASTNDERRTSELDDLAGSQGTIMMKRLALYIEPSKISQFPFYWRLDHKGRVEMIAKYFQSKRKKSEGKKDHEAAKNNGKTSHYEHESNRKKDRSIYKSELRALTNIKSPYLLHAVCKREADLEIVYPKLGGGDLVLLDSDLPYTDSQSGRYLTPDETFLPRFARHLVLAVAYMHRQKGLLHLDLKPENLVVSGPDRKFTHYTWDSREIRSYDLVLIDYGLSMTEERASEMECYRSGTTVTMAPEQIMCTGPPSRATDWWGVGAALYRTRVFWEPSLNDKERSKILHLTCPQWGHPIFPPQPFFDPDLTNLFEMLLIADQKARDFDRPLNEKDAADPLEALLSHPYLKRGV